MLDHIGFDLWSEEYDKTVDVSDAKNTYPFAGYKEILGNIYHTVMEKQNPIVLDIGIGTGTLSSKLYENGCTIYGQDFSPKMITLAKGKMPNAHLFQADFSQGLAEPLLKQSYDYIIATYSLHHLDDARKVSFLQSLLKLLNNDGMIMIGDVMFETREDMEHCKQQSKDTWDNEEIYFVIEELKETFPSLCFHKVSYCSGIITLTN